MWYVVVVLNTSIFLKTCVQNDKNFAFIIYLDCAFAILEKGKQPPHLSNKYPSDVNWLKTTFQINMPPNLSKYLLRTHASSNLYMYIWGPGIYVSRCLGARVSWRPRVSGSGRPVVGDRVIKVSGGPGGRLSSCLCIQVSKCPGVRMCGGP